MTQHTQPFANVTVPPSCSATRVPSTAAPDSEGDPRPLDGWPLSTMQWALRQPGLLPAECCVLAALASHVNKHGECWPSLDTLIAELGGMARSTVRRALDRLESRGQIAREHGGTWT